MCTIAGFDATGGAGALVDLEAFRAHGGEGWAVLTGAAVPGAAGGIVAVPFGRAAVEAQLEARLRAGPPRGWKTGMLVDGPTVRAVAAVCARRGTAPLVVDPVLEASAGGPLLDPGALGDLVRTLLPLADLVTPNLPEAARLLGREAIAPGEAAEAARALLELGPRAALVKGGHDAGPECVDWLAARELGPGPRALALPRLAGPGRRGTGCALASAIAARLALGAGLLEAAWEAKAWVHARIAAGTAWSLPAGSRER